MTDASKPLPNPRHEAFARAIAAGHRLAPAYERAGFAGKSPRLSWELRHRPEVDGRIRWLLEERARADTRAYSRREKRSADLRERVLAELEAIAFSDPGEILNWERTPVLNADGEVTGFESTLQVKDSAKLSREARVGIKSVFSKSGALRFDLHDRLAALLALAKHVRLLEENAPAPSLTINQTNIGEVPALDAARKVAFLLAAARAQALPGPLLDATPVRNSKGADTAPVD